MEKSDFQIRKRIKSIENSENSLSENSDSDEEIKNKFEIFQHKSKQEIIRRVFL